jgi:hypothetical protein
LDVRGRGFQLEDLVDLELQLLRDRDASPDALRRRDRRIGIALRAHERVADDRPSVLREWVHAVRKEEGHEGAGPRFVRAYRTLGAVLVLLGLASGAGTAAAVLAYDGTHPVNVVNFLAVFVAAQLALLLLFLLSSVLWRLRDALPVVSGVYALLGAAFEAAQRLYERRLSAERRSLLLAARGRLRASRVVYGRVERWLLVALGQRFGLWFNVGALATCLYLVAFSDLAFAWQTTLRWTAEGFHRAITALAAPWSWAYPDGVPTLEVVRASRYFRLDESFRRAAPPELLGQWWRFLVLCLVVYGLAPRLVLSLVARARLRRALARLRLDQAEIDSLVERLTVPLVVTQAPVAEAATEPGAEAPAGPAAPAIAPGSAATVIAWGAVPIDVTGAEELVSRRFRWSVAALEVAGVDDTAKDEAVIRAAASAARGPILVLVEGFESPTREARAFLVRLRRAIGVDRPVVVGLLDADTPGRFAAPAPDDLRIWRKHLAALGDPYLRVEALVEPS